MLVPGRWVRSGSNGERRRGDSPSREVVGEILSLHPLDLLVGTLLEYLLLPAHDEWAH